MTPAILDGKACLITGGASGIGRAAVLAFAAAGANVLTADIQNCSSPELPFFAMDVRRPEQIRAAAAKAVALYDRLDCAVNCAGIGGVRAYTSTPGPLSITPIRNCLEKWRSLTAHSQAAGAIPLRTSTARIV